MPPALPATTKTATAKFPQALARQFQKPNDNSCDSDNSNINSSSNSQQQLATEAAGTCNVVGHLINKWAKANEIDRNSPKEYKTRTRTSMRMELGLEMVLELKETPLYSIFWAIAGDSLEQVNYGKQVLAGGQEFCRCSYQFA